MIDQSGDATIEERARHRFGQIRSASTKAIADGALAKDIDDGRFAVPTGLCMSSIARVASNAPDVLPALAELCDLIAGTGDCYLYPPDSLHVSLLALTQREPVSAFEADRIDRVMTVAQQVLSTTRRCAVRLGAVNLQGNQWFLEVVPADDTWATARRRIADAARSVGETPIAFPDTEPIHLNIARITGGLRPTHALALLNRPPIDRGMNLSVVDLVVTDFVVSQAATAEVARIGLTEHSASN